MENPILEIGRITGITLCAITFFLNPLIAESQEPVSFPAKSSDLGSGMYWTVTEFSEGCCIMDLNVQKFIDGSWIEGTGGSSLEDSFDYGVPLYAPADGEICSCWRNFPDENSNRIFTGGNHVVIKTKDNNFISLNHFKPGSIPTELCPPNNGRLTYPGTMDKESGWRVASYIPPGSRPKIREGDYIGTVGSSGNSGGPHLHISMQPYLAMDSITNKELLGDPIPFRFRQAWGHNYRINQNVQAEDWYRHLGGEFTNSVHKIVHPSPFLRRGTASAGTVNEIDVAYLSTNRVVTALKDSDNKLRLISWDLVGLDKISRNPYEEVAGIIKDVKIIKGNGSNVVVAVKGQNDELKLIWYLVNPTGGFTRIAEKSAGEIKDLELIRSWNLPDLDFRFLTVSRDSQNALKIIAWDLEFSGTGGSIIRRGERLAGTVSAFSSSFASNFRGLYTAVRDNRQKLKIIPWRVSKNGMSISRGQDISEGTIKDKISIASINRGMCVAVKDNRNKTRIISYKTSSDGDIIERKSTLVLNEAREINLISTPHAESNISAVFSDSQGNLRLTGLLMNKNGSALRESGSSIAGKASRISAAGYYRSYHGLSPRDLILTGLRDTNGKLRLITWDTNLNNPD